MAASGFPQAALPFDYLQGLAREQVGEFHPDDFVVVKVREAGNGLWFKISSDADSNRDADSNNASKFVFSFGFVESAVEEDDRRCIMMVKEPGTAKWYVVARFDNKEDKESSDNASELAALAASVGEAPPKGEWVVWKRFLQFFGRANDSDPAPKGEWLFALRGRLLILSMEMNDVAGTIVEMVR